MESRGRLSPKDVEGNLRRMLDVYPDATVTGIGDDGQFRPVPDELDLGQRPTFEAEPGQETGLHLVDPVSRAIVVEQFRQRRAKGASVVNVVLLDGRRARLALFDTTELYGVDLFIVIRDDGAPAQPTRLGISELVSVPARSGRMLRTDTAGFIACDDGLVAMLGFAREQLRGRAATDLIHPDDYGAVLHVWLDLLTEPHGSVRRVRTRYRRSDGSWLWVELTFTNLLEDAERPHILTEFVDISQEMAALDEVWRRGELLARLTETLPVGVAEISTARDVTYQNGRLAALAGRDRCDTFADIFLGVGDDDRARLDAALERVLAMGYDADLEVRLRPTTDQPVHYCQVSMRPLHNQEGQVSGAQLCLVDVTDNTRLRQELEIKASYDDLTGCLNRATIVVEIERALALQDRGTALVYIDLDKFKEVNDTLGHSAGDAVLVAVSQALGEAVRSADRLGRIGGDEFVVLCPAVASRRRAEEIAQRLRDAIHLDLDLDGVQVPVRASVGVSWTTERGVDADSLVASADRAMYEAKRAGAYEPVTVTVGS